MSDSANTTNTVIILTDIKGIQNGFVPPLAPVATLPNILRNILTLQGPTVGRTLLCVESEWKPQVMKALQRTGRAPKSLEWYESLGPVDLTVLTRHTSPAGNLILVLGNHSIQPSVLRKTLQWNSPNGAMTFCCDDELVGIYVLSKNAAETLANERTKPLATLEDLHHWLKSRGDVEMEEVDERSWQKICSPADRIEAEKKLDQWLVKPTDGIFARMNRRVSIPISRWLLQFSRITPNMVTLFTLWVSFGAGLFFAYGGYWATLMGALLSVWASIMDGCDGEVARLKIQVTDFGCWLDTVCDYLYYAFVFGGMAIGFARTIGARFTLLWGPLLLLGAVASFLATGFARHHFSGKRPEAFLATWQKKAERRRSNPLLYIGRHCEFIIRRCFLPYAFLAFAVLNILPVAFVMTAVGANIVWCIALYSCFALSRRRELQSVTPPATTVAITN
jgi:phosphatidylglycerophosphate synthase